MLFFVKFNNHIYFNLMIYFISLQSRVTVLFVNKDNIIKIVHRSFQILKIGGLRLITSRIFLDQFFIILNQIF